MSVKTGQEFFQSKIEVQYSIHNAYTNPKSIQQVVTIIIAIVQIAVNSVYVPQSIFNLKSRILQFLFITNYAILLIVIGHYIYLTAIDPVDSLILDQEKSKSLQKHSPKDSIFCIFCYKIVKKKSYHCMKCGRCTQQFDHHCKYLNNCICMRNYKSFIKLLLFYLIYSIGNFLQSFWIYKLTQDPSWAYIFMMILNAIIIIAIACLLIFHIYLNCFLKLTTYQFVVKWRKDHEVQYGYNEQRQMEMNNQVDSGEAMQKKQRIQSIAEPTTD